MSSESILVLNRATLDAARCIAPTPGVLLFKDGEADSFTKLIASEGLFLPRAAMETDPTYKQIIPYMIFVHQRRLFVMQRSAQAGEQRLAGKYTIGIGGHVCAEDLDLDGIVGWGMREFEEEVAYNGVIARATVFGLVNDDRDAVGQVHLGVVIILRGESEHIAVRSELISGFLMDREECFTHFDRMETWSQFVVLQLIDKNVL